VEEGAVNKVVAEMIRTKAIDLIVLATQGRSGLGKFLLGSVAEEVFRSATCPVLTVGPHVRRGTGNVSPRHILFATDFGPESALGVAYALSLAEENHARLTLLHVLHEPGVSMPEPGGGSMSRANPYDEVLRKEKQLRELVPPDAVSQKPEYLVLFGWPVETILRQAAKDVDMIVLGVKRPAVLTKYLGRGVAYRVMCSAPCPVLTSGATVRSWPHLASPAGAPRAA
jgi:nucleotide-binding universal stress UspA family protein